MTISRERRIEAFRWVVARTASIPVHENEIGIQGTLGTVATAFLLDLEHECYTAAKRIADGDGRDLTRKSKTGKPKKRDRERRFRTIASLYACAIYFDETCPSYEMVALLNLLMSLAVDCSHGELSEIVQPIVINAAQADSDRWQLLEKEFEPLCRLIERHQIEKGEDSCSMNERLRALVIPASGWWIIQFIEHDMATVTRIFEEIPAEVRQLLATVERRTRDEDAPSFRAFESAPEEYLTRFEVAAPLTVVHLGQEFAPTKSIELRLETGAPANGG